MSNGADSGRSRWQRALSVVLVLLAILTIVIQGLAGTLIPPLVAFAAVFAAMAAVVSRVRSVWPIWLVLVLVLLFTAGNVPFIVSDVGHPESVGSFVPMWLVVVASVFAVVAVVALLRRATATPKPFAITALVIAVGGIIASGAVSAGVADDDRQPDDVVIVAEAVEYPREVRVRGGAAVFVDNRDPFRHTFVVEDIHQELPGRTARRVPLDLPAGSHEFVCDVPGHEDMKGTLIVEG